MTPLSNTPVGPVAYVMTHYPRVALTYISGEIDALEARGLTIVPFAMNRPAPGELSSPDLERRARETFYLKEHWGAGLAALTSFLFRRPVSTMSVAMTAMRSAGSDLDLLVRRLAHLVQGALLARECEQRKLGHVHAHFGQAPASIAWFASELSKQHRMRRLDWSFTIHGFQDFVDEAVARLDLKAASARFVVCVSDFTRSQLCRITPSALWDKFHVVRCGIDLAALPYRSEEPRSEVLEILTVGRLSPEKGFSILLRALAALKARGVHARLTIIGDGPGRAEIERDVAALGLGGDVTLTGELPPSDVAERLRSAHLFCLPSFAEGLPISIMEAMAVGVPVVATQIAGIPELAINQETALTVPAGNVDALASALERLLTDPALRKQYAAAGRREVERRHDRERSADLMLHIFADGDAA